MKTDLGTAMANLALAAHHEGKQACKQDVLDRVTCIVMEAKANPMLSDEFRSGVFAACKMVLLFQCRLYDLPADLVRDLASVPEIVAPLGV